MNTSTAREYAIERALEIDHEQFEQLCKMAIEQSERTKELELTPFRQDGGIDIQAIIDREIFHARLGVQVKQYNSSNTVGRPSIQQFKGALFDVDYHIGTFITSSRFTSEAIESAEQSYIRLIDGGRLTDILLNSEIGVTKTDDGFEEDPDFWGVFRKPEREGLLPSSEVPQADKIEVMRHTLAAIDDGLDVKPLITDYLQDYDPRQADYYPSAAWILGLVHQDLEKEYKGRTVRQWRLTRRGEEYLAFVEIGDEDGARELLREAIKEVEIVKRITSEIQNKGTITHTELKEIIGHETMDSGKQSVTGTTVKRRATTLANWIDYLAEYRKLTTGGPQRYEYVGDGLSNYV